MSSATSLCAARSCGVYLKDKLIAFVLSQIKPPMAADEILHLDLEVEAGIEGENL